MSLDHESCSRSTAADTTLFPVLLLKNIHCEGDQIKERWPITEMSIELRRLVSRKRPSNVFGETAIATGTRRPVARSKVGHLQHRRSKEARTTKAENDSFDTIEDCSERLRIRLHRSDKHGHYSAQRIAPSRVAGIEPKPTTTSRHGQPVSCSPVREITGVNSSVENSVMAYETETVLLSGAVSESSGMKDRDGGVTQTTTTTSGAGCSTRMGDVQMSKEEKRRRRVQKKTVRRKPSIRKKTIRKNTRQCSVQKRHSTNVTDLPICCPSDARDVEHTEQSLAAIGREANADCEFDDIPEVILTIDLESSSQNDPDATLDDRDDSTSADRHVSTPGQVNANANSKAGSIIVLDPTTAVSDITACSITDQTTAVSDTDTTAHADTSVMDRNSAVIPTDRDNSILTTAIDEECSSTTNDLKSDSKVTKRRLAKPTKPRGVINRKRMDRHGLGLLTDPFRTRETKSAQLMRMPRNTRKPNEQCVEASRLSTQSQSCAPCLPNLTDQHEDSTVEGLLLLTSRFNNAFAKHMSGVLNQTTRPAIVSRVRERAPHEDVLARELGPRFNWLEQKIHQGAIRPATNISRRPPRTLHADVDSATDSNKITSSEDKKVGLLVPAERNAPKQAVVKATCASIDEAHKSDNFVASTIPNLCVTYTSTPLKNDTIIAPRPTINETLTNSGNKFASNDSAATARLDTLHISKDYRVYDHTHRDKPYQISSHSQAHVDQRAPMLQSYNGELSQKFSLISPTRMQRTSGNFETRMNGNNSLTSVSFVPENKEIYDLSPRSSNLERSSSTTTSTNSDVPFDYSSSRYEHLLTGSQPSRSHSDHCTPDSGSSQLRETHRKMLRPEREELYGQLNHSNTVLIPQSCGADARTKAAYLPSMHSDTSTPFRTTSTSTPDARPRAAHSRQTSVKVVVRSDRPPAAHRTKYDLSAYTCMHCSYDNQQRVDGSAAPAKTDARIDRGAAATKPLELHRSQPAAVPLYYNKAQQSKEPKSPTPDVIIPDVIITAWHDGPRSKQMPVTSGCSKNSGNDLSGVGPVASPAKGSAPVAFCQQRTSPLQALQSHYGTPPSYHLSGSNMPGFQSTSSAVSIQPMKPQTTEFYRGNDASESKLTSQTYPRNAYRTEGSARAPDESVTLSQFPAVASQDFRLKTHQDRQSLDLSSLGPRLIADPHIRTSSEVSPVPVFVRSRLATDFNQPPMPLNYPGPNGARPSYRSKFEALASNRQIYFPENNQDHMRPPLAGGIQMQRPIRQPFYRHIAPQLDAVSMQQRQLRHPIVINDDVEIINWSASGPSSNKAAAASSSPLTSHYKCTTCANPASFICSACKRVPYCSQECQATSWRLGHSAVCGTQVANMAS